MITSRTLKSPPAQMKVDSYNVHRIVSSFVTLLLHYKIKRFYPHYVQIARRIKSIRRTGK